MSNVFKKCAVLGGVAFITGSELRLAANLFNKLPKRFRIRGSIVSTICIGGTYMVVDKIVNKFLGEVVLPKLEEINQDLEKKAEELKKSSSEDSEPEDYGECEAASEFAATSREVFEEE